MHQLHSSQNKIIDQLRKETSEATIVKKDLQQVISKKDDEIKELKTTIRNIMREAEKQLIEMQDKELQANE